MRNFLNLFGLLLTATLLLVACSSEEDSKKNEEQPKTEEAASASKGEIEKAQAQMKDSVPTRLKELAETYGFLFDEFQFEDSKYEIGIKYAKLVDFNADGVDELITIHKGNLIIESEEKHRMTDDYVLEIYGSNLKEAPGEMHTENIPREGGDLSVGLIELKDGSTAYYTRTKDKDKETTTYYEMKEPGRFAEKKFTTQSKSYLIDDKEIDEKTYADELKHFEEGKDIPIITSENGKKMFTFNEKSSGKMVADILTKYDDDIVNILSAGEEIDASEVQEAANGVRYTDRVDVNDKKLYDEMLTYVILYEGAKPDAVSNYIYDAINQKQVAEKFENIFGVPLTMDGVELPSPEEEEFSLVAYKDKVFYLLPTDYYSPYVVRHIDRAVKLPNDTYYLQVHDLEFNLQGYYAENKEATEDAYLQFVKKPVEEWPEGMQKYAKTNIQRYIVMKMVDGEPTFRYIGYQPLTLEQITEY